jgi:hypothetical protein
MQAHGFSNDGPSKPQESETRLVTAGRRCGSTSALENVDDLKTDLARGFAALKAG